MLSIDSVRWPWMYDKDHGANSISIASTIMINASSMQGIDRYGESVNSEVWQPEKNLKDKRTNVHEHFIYVYCQSIELSLWMTIWSILVQYGGTSTTKRGSIRSNDSHTKTVETREIHEHFIYFYCRNIWNIELHLRISLWLIPVQYDETTTTEE